MNNHENEFVRSMAVWSLSRLQNIFLGNPEYANSYLESTIAKMSDAHELV
jgi:hypothetical protein